MKKLSYAALAIMTLSCSNTFAECVAPTVPELADGATATMDQMLESKTAVTDFQSGNGAYLDCLDDVMAEARENISNAEPKALKEIEATYQEVQQAYNDAVSQEESLANTFNASIKAFNKAQE